MFLHAPALIVICAGLRPRLRGCSWYLCPNSAGHFIPAASSRFIITFLFLGKYSYLPRTVNGVVSFKLPKMKI